MNAHSLLFLNWIQSNQEVLPASGPTLNIVIIVGIIAAALAVIGYAGTVALKAIGVEAVKSGSAPKSPEAFTSFFLQSARIATVGVILMATVILALMGKLTEGAVGILSGVAGYVLGGTGKSAGKRGNNQKNT